MKSLALLLPLLALVAAPARAEDSVTIAPLGGAGREPRTLAERIVAERVHALVARLDRNVMPEILFRDARLADVCAFLTESTCCHCEMCAFTEVPVWAEGNLLCRLDREGVLVSLSATNVPLGQVALRVAERVGADLVAGESFLLFRDRGSPPWDPLPFYARTGADAAAAEAALDRVRMRDTDLRGCPFPEFASWIQEESARRDPEGTGVRFDVGAAAPFSPFPQGGNPGVPPRDPAWLDFLGGAFWVPETPRISLRDLLEIAANAAGCLFVLGTDGEFEPTGRADVSDDPDSPRYARRFPFRAAREATLLALNRARAGDAFDEEGDSLELREFLRRLDAAARACPSGGGLRFDVDPAIPEGATCDADGVRHLSTCSLHELLDAATFRDGLSWFVRADGTVVVLPGPQRLPDPDPISRD